MSDRQELEDLRRMAELEARAGIQPPAAEAAKPDGFMQRTGSNLARQAGLALRYGVEGAGSIPATIANLPAAASNAAFGTEFPEQNQALSNVLTYIGLPQPKTGTERVVGDASRAVAGLATGGPLAKVAGAPAYIQAALSNGLKTQAASAISGATAGGLTREAGGGPIAQFVANIAGGVLPVGGAQISARGLKDLGRAVRNTVKPFTTSGREQIVGGLLTENTSNVPAAIQNLDNIKTYIPNSPVTTGEAAKDAGLASLQRGQRNQGNNPFANIESQQNAARQEALTALAGTPQELQGAVQNRSTVTSPLYEQAQTEFLAGKNYNTILAKIDSALENVGTNTQAGKELLKMKSDIQASLPSSSTIKTGLLDANGTPITKTTTEATKQGGLVQLYRELRDRAAKTSELDGAYPSAVRGVVKPIISDLGKSLESQSPSLSAANQKFRELSPEIEQMQLLQDLQQRVSLTGSPDIRTGYEFVSQPKLTGALRDGNGELAQTLTPKQMNGLRNVAADAERSAALNSRTVRPTGSDTVANANGANIVKQFLSEHAVGKLPLGIGRVVQSMSEKQVQELTLEALKDPQLARRLLVEFKPELANTPYSGAMVQKLAIQAIGSSYAASQPKKEQK